MLVIDDVHRKQRSVADPGRLAREARMLLALRHPGVVALASVPDEDPEELVLRAVPGGDLRGRRFSPEEIAGLGAAAATTLADLHDLGAVHHALRPEHVLLDRAGAPVLCSFGRAAFEPHPRRRADLQAGDVVALIELLCGLFAVAGTPLQRRLRRMARQRHPSARSLARTLADVDGARLPALVADGNDPTDVEPEPVPLGNGGHRPAAAALGRRRRTRLVVLLATFFVVGALGAGLALVGVFQPSAAGVPCPAVDAGCQPVPAPAGVLSLPSGRWSFTSAGKIVTVLGRWGCGAALPAMLQPATGQIWVFDRWPRPGPGVTGRAVARVRGATTLAVVPGRACDRLDALGPGPSRRLVDVRQAS